MSDATTLVLPNLVRLRAAARGLELGARRLALSSQSGGYLSAYRGRGLEFDQVRAYQSTDDARTIDWKVTARRGMPYTKQFREERERPVLILVDLHPGMYFGSRKQFKSVLAGRLAALLAWAAARAGDRVGGVVAGAEHHREIPPAGRDAGVVRLLQAMVALQPQAPGTLVSGRLDGNLARMARVAHPGSLVVILSDFRELGEESGKHLTALAGHNDVVAALLYDPLEAMPPPAGHYRIGRGSDRQIMDTTRLGVRARWRQQFQIHHDDVQALCRRRGIHFMTATTTDTPLRALQLGLRQQNQPQRQSTTTDTRHKTAQQTSEESAA